jgi:hypothetical protein
MHDRPTLGSGSDAGRGEGAYHNVNNARRTEIMKNAFKRFALLFALAPLSGAAMADVITEWNHTALNASLATGASALIQGG